MRPLADDDRTNAGLHRTEPWTCMSHVSTIDDLAARALARLADEIEAGCLSQEALKAMRAPHVTAMAHALAEVEETAALALVHDLLESGVSVQELCLDHLAPAARELGTWWDGDRLAFTEVNLATARIQSILKHLPPRRPVLLSPGAPGAVFASVPGEAHTLGVMMAADHFRRLGWDVSLFMGLEQAELRSRLASDDRPLVGLSCSTRRTLPALQNVVAALRRDRPEARIFLSGHILANDTDPADLPDCDGLVRDLEEAEAVLGDAHARVG